MENRVITYYKTNEISPNNGKKKIIGVYNDSIDDFKFFNKEVELGGIVTEEQYLEQESEYKNSNYVKRYCMAYTSREDWEKRYPNDSWDNIMSKSLEDSKTE